MALADTAYERVNDYASVKIEVEKEKGYDTGFIKKLAELSYDIEFNEKKRLLQLNLVQNVLLKQKSLWGMKRIMSPDDSWHAEAALIVLLIVAHRGNI